MILKSICSAMWLLVALSAFAQAQPAWKKFSHPQGAFTAEFPGEPKLTEATNQSPEGYAVKTKMFSVQETGNVSYVLFNEMEAGVNILDDSLYLNTVTNQIIERFGREPKLLENIVFEGVPGKHFVVEFPDGVAEGKILLRTNRAYFVVGFFPRARENDRKKFLDSFHFLPYQKMASVTYQSKEHFFKINFPSTPKSGIEQNEDGPSLYTYYAMDPQSGNNYSVVVDKYSVYAQFESDSAVLENRRNGYILTADSIISEKDVIVDGRPAKDLIINQGTNNFKMRVRIFTNGNYSYTIFTFLPYNEIRLPHVNQFFDSFRFTARVPGNLLSAKGSLMLNDMESEDTTVLKELMPFFDLYDFNESHVAKIQSLLFGRYPDDADALRSRKIILLESLAEIKSKTSVDFIRHLFPTLKGNTALEFNALDVLVKLNTREANNLLTELLPDHEPVKGDIWKYSQVFSHNRIDSAQAKEFLFKTLPLLSRQPYKTGLYSLIENLLRSKQLQFDEVSNIRHILDVDFKLQFESFASDTIYQYLDDLTSLIGYDKVGKPELEMLKQLAATSEEFIEIRANTTLLRLRQKPNEKTLAKLAASRSSRAALFHELNDFELQSHFPKAYYRQDSIAIGEFFADVSSVQIEPTAVKIVHTEAMAYKGKQKIFFVMAFTDSEDGTTYRGVAGPYAQDKVEVFGERTGSFFDDKNTLNHHEYLVDYLSKLDNP